MKKTMPVFLLAVSLIAGPAAHAELTTKDKLDTDLFNLKLVGSALSMNAKSGKEEAICGAATYAIEPALVSLQENFANGKNELTPEIRWKIFKVLQAGAMLDHGCTSEYRFVETITDSPESLAEHRQRLEVAADRLKRFAEEAQESLKK